MREHECIFESSLFEVEEQVLRANIEYGEFMLHAVLISYDLQSTGTEYQYIQSMYVCDWPFLLIGLSCQKDMPI